MNRLIYTPTGKAREYSPLALNIYKGCDHACAYCYARRAFGQADHAEPRAGLLHKLARELDLYPLPKQQVLLSFMGDPYCLANEEHKLTGQVLHLLLPRDIPVAILTKGGLRGLRDIDLLAAYKPHVKLGATLTFLDPSRSFQEEPGAASPAERLCMLKEAHERGIKTFASIEPVIDPKESLDVIRAALPYVDQFKVGRLNHDVRAREIDWPAFGKAAISMIRNAGKELYVKVDLRASLPITGYLIPQECDPDALALKA